MITHFMALKNPCPAIECELVLSQEIKDYVLANRVYHFPKETKSTTIINNIKTLNQMNNIHNIIAGMDVVEKVEKYLTFNNQSLIDFETTIENKYKKTVNQLDTDAFTNNYLLKDKNILDMVGKASLHSKRDDPICSQNFFYDKKLKEIKVFDGSWESMSLDAGTNHYIERIQKNFLDAYERYLLRNIHNMRQSQERAIFREMLEQYYAFICCFDMDPYCKDATDDEILRPVSHSENDESQSCCSDDSIDSIMRIGFRNECTKINEEYYPLFKKVQNNLTKTYINKMVKAVQDIIKRNSTTNLNELDKKITGLFHMEETFRDLLLSLKM